MAENVQVLRLELSQSTSEKAQLITPGNLLVGAVGRSTTAKSFKQQYEELNVFGAKGETPSEKKLQRAVGYNMLKESVSRPSNFKGNPHPIKNRFISFGHGTGIVASNINYDPMKKYGPKAVTTALAGYTLYSQYKTTGYTLSGASHQAQMQQRKTQQASFATGIGLSLATGQYWATALMLAGRAWQLSQTNRQELYQIKSSQIISNIQRERLIKDTVQRRF
jgi:hypothetical protein